MCCHGALVFRDQNPVLEFRPQQNGGIFRTESQAVWLAYSDGIQAVFFVLVVSLNRSPDPARYVFVQQEGKWHRLNAFRASRGL